MIFECSTSHPLSPADLVMPPKSSLTSGDKLALANALQMGKKREVWITESTSDAAPALREISSSSHELSRSGALYFSRCAGLRFAIRSPVAKLVIEVRC